MSLKVPVAVFFILKQDDRVLLIRRASHLSHPHLYGAPGGRVEKGEGIRDAVNREAFEELGIDLSESKPLLCYPVFDREIESGFEQIEFYFVFDSWKGDITNKEPDKHVDMAFFNWEQIPSPSFSILRQVIDNIRNNLHDVDFVSEKGC